MFKNTVIRPEFTRLINRLPTSGTMKKAVGEEPYLASMTCMLAMAVGTADARFSSSFSEAGVNQTLHRIELELTVPMTLLLPGGPVETESVTRLCVAETVIVGRVPDAYLQMERPGGG